MQQQDSFEFKSVQDSNSTLNEYKESEMEPSLMCPHPGCSKRFHKQFSLNSHMVMHRKSKQFACHLCGQSFARNHDLLRHGRTVHCPDRPFKCNTCHQTFSSNAKLASHCKRTHGFENDDIESPLDHKKLELNLPMTPSSNSQSPWHISPQKQAPEGAFNGGFF
jgi:hypothetical protein